MLMMSSGLLLKVLLGRNELRTRRLEEKEKNKARVRRSLDEQIGFEMFIHRFLCFVTASSSGTRSNHKQNTSEQASKQDQMEASGDSIGLEPRARSLAAADVVQASVHKANERTNKLENKSMCAIPAAGRHR